MTMSVGRPNRRTIRIWVPIPLVLLVLLPFLVVGLAVACVVFHVNVLRAYGAGWRLFSALRGARFDVQESGMAIRVAIR